MTHYDDVSQLADQLSLIEKVRLLEHLSAALKQELESEAFKKMPWHEFIERTAGILADDPIQRWPQGSYEEREPLKKTSIDMIVRAARLSRPQCLPLPEHRN
jgi:hypothetical protein